MERLGSENRPRGLGNGPAEVFAATYGVDLDDFHALGWSLWAQVRAGSRSSSDRRP